jgi:hypothetical protein
MLWRHGSLIVTANGTSLRGDGGSRAVTIRRLESYFLEFRSLSTLDFLNMGIFLCDRCFVK